MNTQDEDLKRAVLNGTLNVVNCPRCAQSCLIREPLLYHDMERNLYIWIYDGSRSKDPRRKVNPAMASAIAALGDEMVAADDFECARRAIVELEDREAFARIRFDHRDWPDSKVYARMFEQSFQAAKERLGESLGVPPLREAFLDSMRPDAPAPPLWWVWPMGGIILGVVLFAWSPFVGTVVAGLSATLLLVGIARAARHRPPPSQQKGAN